MQMDLLWVFIILNASPKILWMRVLIIIRGGIKVSQQINYGLDRDFSLQQYVLHLQFSYFHLILHLDHLQQALTSRNPTAVRQ